MKMKSIIYKLNKQLRIYSNLFKKCWIKRDETLQNNPKLIGFSKKCNVFGKFCQNIHGKTKKKSGIKSFDLGN